MGRVYGICCVRLKRNSSFRISHKCMVAASKIGTVEVLKSKYVRCSISALVEHRLHCSRSEIQIPAETCLSLGALLKDGHNPGLVFPW
jgi:hypothetical protein